MNLTPVAEYADTTARRSVAYLPIFLPFFGKIFSPPFDSFGAEAKLLEHLK